MKRAQRLMRAINSLNFRSWDIPHGENYRLFTDLGLDVTVTEDTGFIDQEIQHEGRVLYTAPNRSLTIRAQAETFWIDFKYSIIDLSQIMDAESLKVSDGLAGGHGIDSDNFDALDLWLDQAVWDHKIDLRDPTKKGAFIDLESGTGSAHEFTYQGGTGSIRQASDGTFQLKLGEKTIELDQGGSINVDIKNIRSVSIRNILELTSYSVTRNEDRTFHIFDFANQGHGEITYNLQGRLEVFSLSGTTMSISRDDEISIGMGPSPANQ